MAAWFGGRREGDKSTEIWTSRKTKGGNWSAPAKFTNLPSVATWNPVLFVDKEKTLWLFYKIGTDEEGWVGTYRKSTDEGRTWNDVVYFPAGLLGPIRSKPITLSDGTILAPSSVEGYHSWASWMERSTDGGKSWTRHGPLVFPAERDSQIEQTTWGVIQPTIWQADDGRVIALMRSRSYVGVIVKSVSKDGGVTWGPVTRTELPHPNSGFDAVKMKDGRVAMVYNHTPDDRSPLNLAFSSDDGETWGQPHVLEQEKGEYSYPAVIQSSDGRLQITYTWKRKRIKHVVVDPAQLK